jgi:hypothetical protein
VAKHDGGVMPPEDYSRYVAESRAAEASFAAVDALEKRERRYKKIAKGQARVSHEPPAYAPDSPHSWFRDTVAAQEPEFAPAQTRTAGTSDMSRKAVLRRLDMHQTDIRAALRKGNKYGKRIEQILSERERTEDPSLHEKRRKEAIASAKEVRTTPLGTDGGISATAPGEASAFVSPAFVLEAYARYRGVGRPFASQCKQMPIPQYGMHVYVPYFSSASSVTEQTENAAVSESAPSTALESDTVKTITGQIIISQQLHDRGFYGGGTMDAVIAEQLKEQVDQKVNEHVVAQAITGGKSISGASSANYEEFYKDLTSGREELADQAGTRLRATHFFSSTDFFGWFSKLVDTTNKRPLILPEQGLSGYPSSDAANTFDGEGAPRFAKYQQTVLPGGLVWITDDSLPLVGTTTKINLLVSAPAVSIVVFESPQPIITVVPQQYANVLETIVNCRVYSAAVTRHASGTAVIQGSAWVNSLK